MTNSEPDPPSSPPEPAPASTALARWRLAGFRFVLLYWLLSLAADFSTIIPVLGEGRAWLAYSAAKMLFGPAVPDGSHPTGSGDRAVDWAIQLVVLALAVLAAAVWSARAWKRKGSYPRLHAATLLLLRLHLALTLMGYGAVKVLQSQFPQPTPVLLSRSLGDSTSMGILWKFMGHSASYNVFTGGAELLCTLLLLFRRTRLLGALLSIGVMANVVMLNLSYNVAVKLGSAHLLLMAMFIAWPDRRQLLALLVKPAKEKWPTGRARWLVAALLGSLVALATWFTGVSSLQAYHTWGAGREHHPRYGSYTVEEFEVNGVPVPAEQCGGDRWSLIHIHDEHIVAQTALGRAVAFAIKEHSEGTLKMVAQVEADSPEASIERTFVIRDRGDEQFELSGDAPQGKLRMLLKKKHYRLNQPQFRWISEASYNR